MKSNLTKVLALLMAIAIVFSLGACGKDKDKGEDETTTAQSPTAATGDTTAADTTAAEQTTAVGDTTAVGETTTLAGKPEGNAQILAAYTDVMNLAKTAKPAYNKKEFQSLPSEDQHMKGKVIGYLLPQAERFMTKEADANVEDNKAGSDMKWFPVAKADKGCLLTNTSAIKSAKCDVLANGNYLITIILNDEHNPEPYKTGDTKATSNTGNMFQPLAKSEIDNTLQTDSTIKTLITTDVKYDLKYYDCTAVLEYNPQTKQIVSISQNMSVFINITEGKILGLLDATGTAILYNNMKAWNFKY
jgi:hypothetical protein